MTIESMENGPVISNESENKTSESEAPASIEDVTKRFANPEEITTAEEIIPFFENNLDKNRLCITIPITTKDDETRKQELLKIGQNLRKAIFKYTGIERGSSIGASLEGLIGEATSDVAKHTVFGDRFHRILALVTKDNLDISFHLVNPARSDVDLDKIRQEDSPDEYDPSFHGKNFSKQLGDDLRTNGCQSVVDKSCLVKDTNSETVAVERDISIALPS